MRSVDEIYASMCRSFSAKSGMEVIEGGDMSLRLYAVAFELASLEANADFVARQAFPQTAAGEYLDMHAQMRGLERREAVKAQGKLRFYTNSPATVKLKIDAGTVCMSEGMEEFVTVEDGEIAAGETMCDIDAQAVNAGKAGNVPAGAVTVMENAPIGVSGVTNTQAFAGGCDAESDEELSARVTGSYRRLPNGANKAYYEQKALSIDGVCAVNVIPKGHGIGTVDIIISGYSGVPDGELIEDVAKLIEAEREICVDISVSAPQTREVDVAAQLVFAPEADAQEVIENAEKAMHDYFDGRLLGKNIYRAKLGAMLMGIDGVENCTLTAPQEDIEFGETQMAILGLLDITEAV